MQYHAAPTHSTHATPPRQRTAVAAVALCALLVSTACGGGANRGGAAGTAVGEVSQRPGGDAPSPPAIAPGANVSGIAGGSPVPGTSPVAGGSPVAARRYSVNLTNDLKYEPVSLTVPAGSEVTFNNISSREHTVTDDPSRGQGNLAGVLPPGAQPFDSGIIAPGRTFTMVFSRAGTYQYFCQMHGDQGMVGTIVVQP